LYDDKHIVHLWGLGIQTATLAVVPFRYDLDPGSTIEAKKKQYAEFDTGEREPNDLGVFFAPVAFSYYSATCKTWSLRIILDVEIDEGFAYNGIVFENTDPDTPPLTKGNKPSLFSGTVKPVYETKRQSSQ